MNPPNKEKARKYHTAVSEYDVATVEKMVRKDYIQHNLVVPDGRAAFLELFPRLKQHNSKIQNIRIFEDGAHVIMHHLWKNAAPFGADEKIAFHIIRFGDDGLIAEHWSVMTDNAAVNPSGRSLIDGPTEVIDGDTKSNKAKVTALFECLTKAEIKDFDKILPQFFSPKFHQHHPDIGDGIDGFRNAVSSGKLDFKYDRQHEVFGSGNFVLSISEGTRRGKATAFYDLYRFENGMIVEHWSVYQLIQPSHPANPNTMFGF